MRALAILIATMAVALFGSILASDLINRSPAETLIKHGFWLMIAFAIWVITIWLGRWLHIWRYDPHNPYRRYCKKCGTEQNYYAREFTDGSSVGDWETVLPVHPCKHNH